MQTVAAPKIPKEGPETSIPLTDTETIRLSELPELIETNVEPLAEYREKFQGYSERENGEVETVTGRGGRSVTNAINQARTNAYGADPTLRDRPGAITFTTRELSRINGIRIFEATASWSDAVPLTPEERIEFTSLPNLISSTETRDRNLRAEFGTLNTKQDNYFRLNPLPLSDTEQMRLSDLPDIIELNTESLSGYREKFEGYNNRPVPALSPTDAARKMDLGDNLIPTEQGWADFYQADADRLYRNRNYAGARYQQNRANFHQGNANRFQAEFDTILPPPPTPLSPENQAEFDSLPGLISSTEATGTGLQIEFLSLNTKQEKYFKFFIPEHEAPSLNLKPQPDRIGMTLGAVPLNQKPISQRPLVDQLSAPNELLSVPTSELQPLSDTELSRVNDLSSLIGRRETHTATLQDELDSLQTKHDLFLNQPPAQPGHVIIPSLSGTESARLTELESLIPSRRTETAVLQSELDIVSLNTRLFEDRSDIDSLLSRYDDFKRDHLSIINLIDSNPDGLNAEQSAEYRELSTRHSAFV